MISAGIMTSVASDAVVKNMDSHRVLGHDGLHDHTFLAFPYCIAMVFGSVILQGLAVVSLGAHLYKAKEIIVKRSVTPRVSFDDVYEETKIAPSSVVNVTPPVERKFRPQEEKTPPVMKTVVSVISKPADSMKANDNMLSEKL